MTVDAVEIADAASPDLAEKGRRVEAPRPASQARIEANRRNAARSTGPKTDEGKRRARANALKHGLTALKTRLGDEEAKLARRRDALVEKFGGDDEAATLLCEQAAHASVQIDRVGVLLGVAMQAASIRAEAAEAWAVDRRADVERAALKLSSRPSASVAKLMDSPQGIDWLIDRWQMLRFDSRQQQGWTEVEVSLAMDLMGIPVDFRWLGVVRAYNEVVRPETEASTVVEVCDRMIDGLERMRGTASEIDEVRRQATVLELSDEYAPEARRLARYEAALHRRFRWSIELAERLAAASKAQPESETVAESDAEARIEPAERNEPNAGPPAERNEPNPPDPQPTIREPKPAEPAPTVPIPAKTRRPDPARLLRREKQRRKCA